MQLAVVEGADVKIRITGRMRLGGTGRGRIDADFGFGDRSFPSQIFRK